MKINYYAIPTLLTAAALVAAFNGVSAKKNAELAKSQIVLRDTDTGKSDSPKTAEIISAANAIEEFAAKAKLPLSIEIKSREITMSSAQKKSTAPLNPKAQPPRPATPAEGTGEQGEDKDKTLQNPTEVLSFFRDVGSLPYKMSYKSLCIGLDCKSAIEAVISFGEETTTKPSPEVAAEGATKAPPKANP